MWIATIGTIRHIVDHLGRVGKICPKKKKKNAIQCLQGMYIYKYMYIVVHTECIYKVYKVQIIACCIQNKSMHVMRVNACKYKETVCVKVYI